jgi:hypothetical protein
MRVSTLSGVVILAGMSAENSGGVCSPREWRARHARNV